MSTPELLPIKNVDGTLTVDVHTKEGTSRLRTVAPFDELQVTIEPTYSDDGGAMNFGPGYIWHPPTLRYVDLTVRVRLMAGSTPDGTLYQMMAPEAETIEQTIQRVIDGTDPDIVPPSAADSFVLALVRELKARGHA